MTRSVILATIMGAILYAAPLLSLSSLLSPCDAKEIVGTKEWQRVNETDTLPAGLHVRMDLSTGEKWARLVEVEDEAKEDAVDISPLGEVKNDDVVDGRQGAMLSVVAGNATADVNDVINDVMSDITGDVTNDDGENEQGSKRDYVAMHRVMSTLPPEELEQFGGLPPLPALSSSNDTSDGTVKHAEMRRAFEERMEELWQSRQEELRRVQEEHVANLPRVLEGWIEVIKSYLESPDEALKFLGNDRQDGNADAEIDVEIDVEAESENEKGNILSALRDLELQLSDVDMARDFHTLGGWPYLVALLSDRMHHHSDSPLGEQDAETVQEIQSLAAMTIGTAVSNLHEFHYWATQDVSPQMHLICPDKDQEGGCGFPSANAVSLLVHALERQLDARSTTSSSTSSNSRPKSTSWKLRQIYALGTLLRGNPDAQTEFVFYGGPHVVVRDALGGLSHARPQMDSTPVAQLSQQQQQQQQRQQIQNYKFASKVLALGHDILTDLSLYPQNYIQITNDTPLERIEYYQTMGTFTADKLQQAFTTEQWCDLALRMVLSPQTILREKALNAVRTYGPHCRDDNDDESHAWGIFEVKKTREEWNDKRHDAHLDPEYRTELIQLANDVLNDLLLS